MTTYKQFDEIRDAYVIFEQRIFNRHKSTKTKSMWVDPYSLGVDFIRLFSPIEMAAWQALRCYGRAPFYPQYPVNKYFLDFGNPVIKVGIECDGKEFHKDKEKDLKRDAYLHELGWSIYRISGSDCFEIVNETEYTEDYNEDFVYSARSKHYLNTIEGLVESLGIMYFDQIGYGNPEEITGLVCKCLDKRISIKPKGFDERLSDTINNYYNKYLTI